MDKIRYLAKNKKPILIAIDILIVVTSAFLSLFLRFDFDFGIIYSEYGYRMLVFLPADIIVTIAVFWIFRLYHSVWSFASTVEAIRAFEAVVAVNLIELAYKIMLAMPMPRSYYVINTMCMLLMVIVSRLSIRILRHYRYVFRNRSASVRKRRTMLIGGGSAGDILLTEMSDCRSKTESRIVCIIDDNPYKKGSYLLNVPIIGGREIIEESVNKYDIEDIIIAIPSAGREDISRLIGICNRTDCRVKVLPSIARSLKGGIAHTVRDVNFSDVLQRQQVDVDKIGIKGYLTGKTIMVTGGGGSIGSELCRQIMEGDPACLIIFDCYENNAYAIQMELKRKYRDRNILVLIGSVRDIDRMECIFKKYRPDIIYHAAAHKHVPLMEDSPNEAIKNNCMGTLNAVRLADRYKAEKFVLISSDKAVRPTNIMGATKRACEMMIQSFSKISETEYVAVRFGNVFGSNGSVMPLFFKQIEKGGPVTVTHKDITRYFMSIPEAVALVLQAGLYAKGGEIFVLDMGEPVRIYDLAESLIRLKGYIPNKDIKINITGLRPGEKLYEEILMDEEGLAKTPNDMIFIGKPIEMDHDAFMKDMQDIIASSLRNAPDIKEQMARICSTYTITENNNG